MGPDQFASILERLQRIETILGELVGQRATKEWYGTGELASIIGKSEYTVREWCRQGRVRAKKKLVGGARAASGW
jgi:hypothetical protein